MNKTIAVVGDSICGSEVEDKLPYTGFVYLRGFNTLRGSRPSREALLHEGAGEIVAAVSGVIEVTDRVVSVQPRSSRYQPEIGDVVVGRITDVAGNRWKVNINGSQDAILALSNVTQPGGILRRRGRDDELTMRNLFDQDDLIVAEVQRITPEGIPALQTRLANKYGKISSYGNLVMVRSYLVKRAKHHFVSIPSIGVQLIIGVNGLIWVSPNLVDSDSQTAQRETLGDDWHENVAKVSNCIKIINESGIEISIDSIDFALKSVSDAGVRTSEMLFTNNQMMIATKTREFLLQNRKKNANDI